jgi:hypothetical protein
MPRTERYAHVNGEFTHVETIELTEEEAAAEREAIAIEAMQSISEPALAVSLDHENRLRTLEGQPVISIEQFRKQVRELL